MCLAQGHNTVTQLRLEPAAHRPRVKHSTTEPLCSHVHVFDGVTVYLFSEWGGEKLPETNILRLIYQGRFLHGNVTLGGK